LWRVPTAHLPKAEIPSTSASKEFASDFGSPRFARRLIGIQFWGQKRIGGFAFWGKKIF
jgi:hypothetical protein